MSDGDDLVTSVSLRSNPDYLPHVRRIIACLGDSVGMDQQEIDEAKLALTEACANAIIHGSPQGDLDSVQITIRAIHGGITADVTDFGGAVEMPDQKSGGESGFGVRLMQMLSDSVQFIKHKAGLTVRLTKYAKNSTRLELRTLDRASRN